MAAKVSSWRWARRTSQGLFLALFLILFRLTDYGGQDQIPYAVNIFFRLDPLVAAAAILASRVLITLVWYSLIVVGVTLILGRVFCGWFCPMGTLLDLAHKIIPPKKEARPDRYRTWKYLLLGFVLLTALLGLPLVGYLDPFSLLVRGLTVAVDPLFNQVVTVPFDALYRAGPAWISAVSEPVYGLFKKTLLPYRPKVFTLSLLSLLLLLAVFALERWGRRFWCRSLCPLGGLLALLARFSRLRGRKDDEACTQCGLCTRICRLGAIDAERRIAYAECNLCLDCRDRCPEGAISFHFSSPRVRQPALGLSRRAFAGLVAGGLLLPAYARIGAVIPGAAPELIRPPGALPEQAFLDRCVRCGECLKVCPLNALQPLGLEAGWGGIFSPRLVPRIGYCEFNCTLCGQVCPTGAIAALDLPRKQKTVIGLAHFDKNRCLPYARGIPCIVCEEHCPTPDKAIKFREAEVRDQEGQQRLIKQPYVIDRLCIGCGICENKCPLEGKAAVLVTRGATV
ncbi:MAG: 4Fe-4S binding protein [Desulfobacterota bacterium]|jgi:MauM/NapG family ferredoxin protein|nr:4Fe-4S binding protein [Thermodesulfobacteriota bacterium]